MRDILAWPHSSILSVHRAQRSRIDIKVLRSPFVDNFRLADYSPRIGPSAERFCAVLQIDRAGASDLR